MDTIDYKTDERLRWLRFVMNPGLPMPEIKDWQGLFDFAVHQTIAGICSPMQYDNARLNKAVLLKWIRLTRLLRLKNSQLNRKAQKVVNTLKEAGFRCCMLKGQGNAAMYPDPELRTPGDIDVWVDAGEDETYAYVKSLYPQENASFKHIKFPMFEHTGVDVHHTPLKLYHPGHNRRLQRWIGAHKEEQMTHYVRLAGTDTDIAVPTAEFNAVYQMGHILIHLLDEGIGLRHMVDYYYLLRHLQSAPAAERVNIRDMWRSLGMLKLASAVMWVEHEVLGLPEEYLLTDPCERVGRLLLEDMLEGGNFGHYSSRREYSKHGRYAKKWADARHSARFFRLFPGEVSFKMLGKARTVCRIFMNNTKKLI